MSGEARAIVLRRVHSRVDGVPFARTSWIRGTRFTSERSGLAARYPALVEKGRILDEIRRTAADNGGIPLGRATFERETGISKNSWMGKYWARWSDAVAEAGFPPNQRPERIEDDALLDALARVTRDLGRFPTGAELGLARKRDTSIPHLERFKRRLGDLSSRVARQRTHATSRPQLADVLALLPDEIEEEDSGAPTAANGDGSVYLSRHGARGVHYKIGHTYDVPRRHRQLNLETPEKLVPVHVIRTDDPRGIEEYWKRRFAAKCTNGEWFALSREDVAAFKRRKFM